MNDVSVIVAGAGPTGLTLATELRRGGVDVMLLERRAHRDAAGSKALGMQPRTMEMLDQRGIVDRFLSAGPAMQLGNFAGIRLDYEVLPSRFPFGLNILQLDTERILEECAGELGVQVRYSTEVIGLHQDADGVDVTVAGPDGIKVVRADYLVACDGGRSKLRKLVGANFPGTAATMSALVGDVELDDPPDPPLVIDHRERGTVTAAQLRPGWFRVITTEGIEQAGDTVSIDDLRASAVRVAGTDFGMHSPRWISRFNDAARQADRYRFGRVLLAGDAAHIHLPAGGQGMNLGIQDAFNLGWKLASVVRGDVHDGLLDTYHDERHATGATFLDLIRAQSALFAVGEEILELYKVMTHLSGFAQVNAYLSAVISGLDIHYPLGEGHPLLGRRVPDMTIGGDRADPPSRIYESLHGARPVLLDLSGTAQVATSATRWARRVDVISTEGPAEGWELPNLGTVSGPSAVLIRPDGYVAWVSEGAPDLMALDVALATWCGTP